jgi:hypothetical protein
MGLFQRGISSGKGLRAAWPGADGLRPPRNAVQVVPGAVKVECSLSLLRLRQQPSQQHCRILSREAEDP